MGNEMLLLDAALGAAGIYAVHKAFFAKAPTPAPLPPGPAPKPLVGNLADLPPPGEQEWVHWAKHKDLYGPLSNLSVLGQNIMIISEARVAFELFEKRSASYSDRPVMHFGGEMCGWEDALSSQMYSDRFRAYRKNIHQVMGTKAAVSRFYPHQEKEVRRFVLRVLEEPERLQQHIRTEAGAIILKISHGYTIEPRKADPLISLADEALAQFSIAATPGRWMVDIMPFLKYVPDWVPGAGFKKTGARWKRTLTELTEKPYAFTKQQMAAGVASPSYVADLLSAKNGLTPEEEFVVKFSAMSLYSGGADTTVSSMHTFFLAMTLFPEVAAKAQAELDRVIGTDRLPTFDDRASLPYVDAIVKEVLRWHPVAPMGLPHVTSADDVFEGMFIPKGSMLIPNIWLFMHDPSTFHDPDAFKPERFIPGEPGSVGCPGRKTTSGDKPETDPHTLCFGFGRRICPGRELADASVYLSIATALAALDIRKATDDRGNVIEPTVRFTPGIISHPAEFRCKITARSRKAEMLVKAVEEEHPWEPSDAEALVGLKWEGQQ